MKLLMVIDFIVVILSMIVNISVPGVLSTSVLWRETHAGKCSFMLIADSIILL